MSPSTPLIASLLAPAHLLVGAVFILLVGSIIWFIRRWPKLQLDPQKLREAVREFAVARNKAKEAYWENNSEDDDDDERAERGEPLPSEEEKEAAFEQGTYAEVATRFSLDANLLRKELPIFARRLWRTRTAPLLDRAQAAFVLKRYEDAEHLALDAVARAIRTSPARKGDAIQAYTCVAQAAGECERHADYFGYQLDASALVDHQDDPLGWADLHASVAYLLTSFGPHPKAEQGYRAALAEYERVRGVDDEESRKLRESLIEQLCAQKKHLEAEQELRTLLASKERVLGPEHQDLLPTRAQLATELVRQRKYEELEPVLRGTVALAERIHGPEHALSLEARYTFGSCLALSGNFLEAEQELKTLRALEERVFGPEHDKTKRTRNFLETNMKSAEVIRPYFERQKRLLGPDHPDTLTAQHTLAFALLHQPDHAAAESEFRAALAGRQRVLPAGHVDIYNTCQWLATTLVLERKIKEALSYIRCAADGYQHVLGSEHERTKSMQEFYNDMQRLLKEIGHLL